MAVTISSFRVKPLRSPSFVAWGHHRDTSALPLMRGGILCLGIISSRRLSIEIFRAFIFPSEASQKPLFRCLGTPPGHQRLATYEGGHFVPRHHLIKETLD